MIAPDPGLIDLIAAAVRKHRAGAAMVLKRDTYCGCGASVALEDYPAHVAAHVALVVEQHTNGQAAKLAEAVQGMWRLIRKLDETSDGLGDWHDATEYIDWARKEVQEIYVRAALEGEQQ